MIKAMGAHRHYYTFDTFGGFEIADPAGGALGVGAFSDNADAYSYLTQWSRVLPLTPVRGDATKTCSVLTKPLSFVWLDLDMAVLMDPVLRQIWHLCGPDTVIGIDDVGRPETPTVAPWLDDLVKTGVVELVFNSDETAPNTFIRFLRKKADFPAPTGVANSCAPCCGASARRWSPSACSRRRNPWSFQKTVSASRSPARAASSTAATGRPAGARGRPARAAG